jgi:hypothetical protein
LIQIFKELSTEEQAKITNLALNYTDYVRALCGAIFEVNNSDKLLLTLLNNSLNGVSSYKLDISNNILPTKTKWRIV